jgi:hypothetical protein
MLLMLVLSFVWLPEKKWGVSDIGKADGYSCGIDVRKNR